MSKKYLYAVRAEGCEVTYPGADHSCRTPVTIFSGSFHQPAVYTNKVAADQLCKYMNEQWPDTLYTVHKFLPRS